MRLSLALVAVVLVGSACRPTAAPSAPAAPAPRVILLTGFEPFGGGAVNASWEAVRGFDGREMAGCRIVARQLPVVWGQPMELLPRLIDEQRPVAVFAFGQGRPGVITFERVGRNARRPFKDNRGKLPEQPVVVPDGADRLVSPFPIGRLLPALEGTGLPVKVSENAGQYLCDELAYSIEHLRRSRGGFECAFFHVPPLDSELVVSGRRSACDREALRKFVEKLIESWASLPRGPQN